MKSSVILVLCLLASHAFCQCKFLTNKQDEFTGEMNKTLQPVTIARNVYCALARVDSTYIMSIQAPVECVSHDSKVFVKFDDGSVVEYKHLGDVDCSTMPQFISSINYDLNTFRTKKVVKIRIIGNRLHDFDLRDPEYFQKSLRCLQ